MSQSLRVHSQLWEKTFVRIELRGCLDLESYPILEQEFTRWFREGHFSFVIHLQALKQATTGGAAGLIGLLRTAQDQGGTISLVQPNPEITKTFDILGVLPLLNIVSTAHELL